MTEKLNLQKIKELIVQTIPNDECFLEDCQNNEIDPKTLLNLDGWQIQSAEIDKNYITRIFYYDEECEGTPTALVVTDKETDSKIIELNIGID